MCIRDRASSFSLYQENLILKLLVQFLVLQFFNYKNLQRIGLYPIFTLDLFDFAGGLQLVFIAGNSISLYLFCLSQVNTSPAPRSRYHYSKYFFVLEILTPLNQQENSRKIHRFIS
eukprot:TRINITY_DN14795_c0_g1_i1.p2 TRINITY_DN14795_c0_g1~~TRINITY_DN14795_c0_g1_i1.p2  ORF type:complete len:116 (-),score=0.56 TRINITY_DN14795_c0_g1_i1:49-396(-)